MIERGRRRQVRPRARACTVFHRGRMRAPGEREPTLREHGRPSEGAMRAPAHVIRHAGLKLKDTG